MQDELLERVSDLRENVPLELRPIREPMDIDAEDPAIADLPPPLSPQVGRFTLYKNSYYYV